MKGFKSIFKFYVDSSIHVALAICAFAGVNINLTEASYNVSFFIFLFSASVAAYNFVKHVPKIKTHSTLPPYFKSIGLFTFLCFGLLVFAVFHQSIKFLIMAGILGLFTLLYVLPILPRHKSLRNLKSLKIFIIAMVWVGATLWLPLIDQKPLFSTSVILWSFSHFAFVLALILPFEIRDLHYDDKKLATFPQRFGIRATKIFGYSLLFLFIFINFLIPDLPFNQLIINLAVALLTALALHHSTSAQSSYYASFYLEAIPILWFLLLSIF